MDGTSISEPATRTEVSVSTLHVTALPEAVRLPDGLLPVAEGGR